MQNIFDTVKGWWTCGVRHVKGLKWGSELFIELLAVILVFLGVVIFVVLFTPNPEWIYPFLGLSQENETFGLSPKNEALRFLGFSIGGTLLVLGAVIANKRATALDKTARAQVEAIQNQAQANQNQVEANQNQEQGLRQERLKNAIEHLGSSSTSVRLGGAYELFHLAKDTRNLDQTEDLSQTALDILCAHIRQTTSETEYIQKYRSEPSEEIQSLLNLLFVQKHEVCKDRNIDLRLAFLRKANLRNARLQKANLEGTRLQGANLLLTELQGADLISAQLQGATLIQTQLQGATLVGAELQGADLMRVQLQGANLLLAEFQGATLIQDADLAGAELQGAHLLCPRLQGIKSTGITDLLRVGLQGIERKQRDLIFEDNIRQRIGKESDLSGITFSGGMTQGDVDHIVESMPDDEQKKKLLERLMPHVGKPASSKLPEDSGAIISPYTKEEAEKWIVRYQYKAISYKKDPTP